MPEKKSKLKPQHKIVIEELAKGKSQTDAYLKAYPKVKRETARRLGSRLLTKVDISEAFQKRIERNLANAKVTPEEVLGSAVFNMRSSMDDLLDEEGYFDLAKARETGAVDLIKEMEIIESVDLETNQKTVRHKVKFESPAAARKEVANYIGVEKLPPPLTRTEQFYLDLIFTLATRHNTAAEDIFRRAVETDRIPREFVEGIEVKLLGKYCVKNC